MKTRKGYLENLFSVYSDKENIERSSSWELRAIFLSWDWDFSSSSEVFWCIEKETGTSPLTQLSSWLETDTSPPAQRSCCFASQWSPSDRWRSPPGFGSSHPVRPWSSSSQSRGRGSWSFSQRPSCCAHPERRSSSRGHGFSTAHLERGGMEGGNLTLKTN